MTEAVLEKTETTVETNVGLEEAARTYMELQAQMDDLKKKLDSTKAYLIKEIGAGQTYIYDGNRFTVIGETVSNRFDSSTFKKEHKDLYESFMKEVPVKSSLRVTKEKK